MKVKRVYRRTDVKQVDIESLRDRAIVYSDQGVTVGLDIAKEEMVGCLRWPSSEFERPWSVENPAQIDRLLERLMILKETCGLTVGMESTGTYGEAVRAALTAAGIEVHRISGKATSDYQEIFDGVPSQHDGKDAAIIAELTAFGKGTAWPFTADSERVQQIRHQFVRMDCYRDDQVRWTGRLEALLARHWPELTGLLKLGSVTLLKICSEHRSPQRLAADAKAAEKLRGWGGVKLTDRKIEQLLDSAKSTDGVPPTVSEMQWLGEVSERVLASYREILDCRRQLKRLTGGDETMSRYASSIGAPTLSAIWSTVGDPRDYGSSGAFLKALGLNLKERSSGRRSGQLAISKRGPSKARRWIYYWAMRAVQRPELKRWYNNFKRVGSASSGKREHRAMKGLVAMMRKLSRGLWRAMDCEENFEYGKILQPKSSRRRRRRRRRRSRREPCN